MSSEERQQILKMVEDGKISADEAMKLMKALDESSCGDGNHRSRARFFIRTRSGIRFKGTQRA